VIHSVSVYSLLGKLIYRKDNIGKQEYNFICPVSENIVVVKVNTASGVQVAKIVN